VGVWAYGTAIVGAVAIHARVDGPAEEQRLVALEDHGALAMPMNALPFQFKMAT
jgi:hypothetical protein